MKNLQLCSSNLWFIISGLYGDLRGFNRTGIRKEVFSTTLLALDEVINRSYQLARVRAFRAIQECEFYRKKVIDRLKRIPSSLEEIEFESLPVWTRTDQQKFFKESICPDDAFIHSTGGSTGVPVHFYVNRESYERRIAVTSRAYSWAGAEEGKKVLFLWGAPASPERIFLKAKKAVANFFQRRRFINTFIFDVEKMRYAVELIEKWRPNSIIGYSSSLMKLACYLREYNHKLKYRPLTCLSAAEELPGNSADFIREWLVEDVYRTYGCREFMMIGMECEFHKGYHVFFDNLYVEVVDEDGLPVKSGFPGRIIVTDLYNYANPFIRYEIGDYGMFASQPCNCSRPFPLLIHVFGRSGGYVKLSGNSELNILFFPHVMKEYREILAYQIVIKDEIPSLLCIVSPGTPKDLRMVICDRIKRHTGVSLNVEFVDELMKLPNGKVPLIYHIKDSHEGSSHCYVS